MDRFKNQVVQFCSKGDISIYELIERQDFSLKEFFQKIRQLEREGIIEIEGRTVRLKPKYRDTYSNLSSIEDVKCSCCEKTGIEIKGYFKELLDRWNQVTNGRPEAIEVFDQGFISPEGVIRRVAYIYDRGDLLDSEIFIMGDDDLLSIALALTGLPKRVQVVEIDERLVNFINKVAEKENLSLRAEVFDAQQALPDKFKGKFDVFITDPVETLPGFTLFVSRATSSLKGIGCAGYLGLTTIEASKEKWFEIEKRFLEMGFVITDIRRRFSVYPLGDISFSRYQEKCQVYKEIGVKADRDWYTSSFIRLEAVKQPKPLVEGTHVIDEKVYKDDESLATPY
ncbi:bis-aminopropyl spermidine synthase family protein [Desulfothermus sp.]